MNRKLINENGRYGIFYVEEVINGRGILNVKYYYYDNDIKFFDSYPCDSDIRIKRGDRFFGKYRPNKTKSMICCYCPVPKNLIEQPKGGWSSLPEEYCYDKEDNCWTE